MEQKERREKLLVMLKERPDVPYWEIADSFNTSVSTISQDVIYFKIKKLLPESFFDFSGRKKRWKSTIRQQEAVDKLIQIIMIEEKIPLKDMRIYIKKSGLNKGVSG